MDEAICETLGQKSKTRNEVPLEDRWNVEALYASTEVWEKEFNLWARPEQTPHWPELLKYRGTIGHEAGQLRELLEISFQIDRALTKLFTYAHLRHDEDITDDLHKQLYSKARSICYEFNQELSWVQPEILELPEEQLAKYLKDPLLSAYQIHLERIIRLKPHTLTADKEELLALSGKALQASSQTFSALNNADLKFPVVSNSRGEQFTLTHAKYQVYLRDKDRKLREEAFKSMHRTFGGYSNTLCELINGQIQAHIFSAKSRNYDSCLQAALFPNQIDREVYLSLIKTVRAHLPALHRYMRLRKEVLGYDKLHLYDVYVPIVASVEMSFEYAKAEQLVIDSVTPLGTNYQTILSDGLKTQRWVDRFENLNKRSGAYSSGCYDSMPYILMNFQGTFNDLTTLAHEVGHSMHSYMSRTHQPYQYADYPIFVAEVASTFNEELLFHHLMQQHLSLEEKCFLLNQKIEDIRATLFRQTMFAEFELKIHEYAEQNIPLTPKLLQEEYRKLNQAYFGPDVIIDEEIDAEWSRIPHFYYNFYVYQYATGISAAHALCEKVIKNQAQAKEKYLHFLSSGSSHFPIDLLRLAGVDMREAEAVKLTINHFDKLIGELAQLLGIKEFK